MIYLCCKSKDRHSTPVPTYDINYEKEKLKIKD
jgi:hypothetical protein